MHSYTLTMRKQKEKLRKQYHSPLQDFGSSLLSLFCILLQAGSLSPPVLFVLVGTYRVPLPAEYFSAFSSCLDCCVWGGHTFCMLEVVLLFIVEVPSCEWHWMIGLSRFPGYGSLRQCSGGWSWISSLWSAMRCSVVSFEVSMGLVWLLAACILMLRVMFLHCWRVSLVCLALKLVGSWVELGFSVGMEAFGWALVD